MFHSEFGSLQSRVDRARQADDLYFAALLPKETITQRDYQQGVRRSKRDSGPGENLCHLGHRVGLSLSGLSTHHGCVPAVAKLIAYNLIRQVMCEAACEAGVQPWQISFKATMSTLTEMLPVLGMIRDPVELCRVLFNCCRQHTVGNRPDRYEPRVLKRRPKQYKLMQKPRHQYKPGDA